MAACERCGGTRVVDWTFGNPSPKVPCPDCAASTPPSSPQAEVQEGRPKALTLAQKAEAELQGAAAGQCPFCEGGMDSFGGVHAKDCPMLAPPLGMAEAQDCETCEGTGIVFEARGGNEAEVPCPEPRYTEEEVALHRELATMLGPRKPREGVSANDHWIAEVGKLLIERDERYTEEQIREGLLSQRERAGRAACSNFCLKGTEHAIWSKLTESERAGWEDNGKTVVEAVLAHFTQQPVGVGADARAYSAKECTGSADSDGNHQPLGGGSDGGSQRGIAEGGGSGPLSDDDRARLRGIAYQVEMNFSRDDAIRDARFLRKLASTQHPSGGQEGGSGVEEGAHGWHIDGVAFAKPDTSKPQGRGRWTDEFVARVARLPLEQQKALARGPRPESEQCRVCDVLRWPGYSYGGYGPGWEEHEHANWLLNWHGPDPVRCGSIYTAALLLTQQFPSEGEGR